MLVVALGARAAMIGRLPVSFYDQPFTGDSVMIGTCLGTLAEMEAALVLCWGTARLVKKKVQAWLYGRESINTASKRRP